MSYRADVIADNTDEWLQNALRFPTHEAAEVYVRKLA